MARKNVHADDDREPFWGQETCKVEADSVFVLMPYKPKSLFDRVYGTIRVVCSGLGLESWRADRDIQTGKIMESIWKRIDTSKIIVADLTGKNPNVMYELGLAHGIRNDVILITQDDPGTLPFDIKGVRVSQYESSDSGLRDLAKTIEVQLLPFCIVRSVAWRIQGTKPLEYLERETDNPRKNCYWWVVADSAKVARICLYQDADITKVKFYIQLSKEAPCVLRELRGSIVDVVKDRSKPSTVRIMHPSTGRKIVFETRISEGLSERLANVIIDVAKVIKECCLPVA